MSCRPQYYKTYSNYLKSRNTEKSLCDLYALYNELVDTCCNNSQIEASGNNFEIQYNSFGTFGASPQLLWDYSNNIFSIKDVGNNVTFQMASDSSTLDLISPGPLKGEFNLTNSDFNILDTSSASIPLLSLYNNTSHENVIESNVVSTLPTNGLVFKSDNVFFDLSGNTNTNGMYINLGDKTDNTKFQIRDVSSSPLFSVDGSGTVIFNHVIGSNFIPSADKVFNLGSIDAHWNKLYVNEIATVLTGTTVTPLTLSRPTTIGGTLIVNDTSTFNDTLHVNQLTSVNGLDDIVFSADISANDTLRVGGATTLLGSLGVSGTTTMNDISANDTLRVGGATTLLGTLGVSGTTTMTDISANDTLRVGGATTLVGTLDVSGATTMADISANATLRVGGATTLLGTLDVSGATTMTDLSANATLHVGGATTLLGTLDVSGATTMTDISANATLHVGGATTLLGTLDVSGATTMTDISANATLHVGGATTLLGTLDVSGATTMTDISANATLRVGGATTLLGTLDVSGATTMTDISANATLHVGGATTLLGTLDVSGATTMADISANATLRVGGATTLLGTLDVSRRAIMNDISANGNLVVGGTTTLLGTLDLAGLTVNNDISANGLYLFDTANTGISKINMSSYDRINTSTTNKTSIIELYDDVLYTRNIIMTGYSEGIHDGTSSQIHESKICSIGFDSTCNNSPATTGNGYQLQFSRGNTTIGGKLDIKSTLNLFSGKNNTISIDGYTRTMKMGDTNANSPSITLNATNGSISCNSLSIGGTPVTFNTISSDSTTLSLGNNIINTVTTITTYLPIPSSKGLLITIYSPTVGYTLNDGISKTTSIVNNVVTVCISTGTSAGNWAVYASGDVKIFV